MERKEIELIPEAAVSQRGAVLSFWAKALGIPLIVILQLLFLAVFAFRLKLEFDLRSLDKSVAEKEAILAQSSEFERAFRDTQTRLNLISTTRGVFCYACGIREINKLASGSVSLTAISLSPQLTEVSAQAPKGTYFATFVANILADDAVQEAAITSGALDQSGNFVFSLELNLDKDKIANQ